MSITKPKKKTWQEEVKEISEYHEHQVAVNGRWSVRHTAKELNRSHGGTSENLQLAYWMKVFPRIEGFIHRADAVSYMKERRRIKEINSHGRSTHVVDPDKVEGLNRNATDRDVDKEN